MWQITSPPTLRFLASLSVITPLDVEIIAIPKPFITLGKLAESAYFLRPGLETLVNFFIAGNFVCGLYFKAILIFPWLFFDSSNL